MRETSLIKLIMWLRPVYVINSQYEMPKHGHIFKFYAIIIILNKQKTVFDIKQACRELDIAVNCFGLAFVRMSVRPSIHIRLVCAVSYIMLG